ncbi:MAG: DUF61 family protein [Candidatus Thorarchaeota archaeon]|nr:MAG: DUF61 family protein [Candidatus Thorarchaeota archaeon]
MSSFIERMIERDIDTANEHLPRERIPLDELLKSSDPHYVTRDGQVSVFRQEELARLEKDIPSQYHGDIRLPIIILRRIDLGRGIYTVAGEKPDLFMVRKVVQEVVGQVDLEWDAFHSWKPVEQLVRPEVQVLRRELPSTTCLGFAINIDREDG